MKAAQRGVYEKGGRFQAIIGHKGVRIFVGTYDDENDAARAYDRAALSLFGPDAELNLPREKPAMPGELVRIDSIICDPDLQTRARMDDAAVARWSARLAGDPTFQLPAVVVFEDDEGKRWLADGWHRGEAYTDAGREWIPAEVRKGSRRDALRYALECNQDHGVPLTTDDDRRRVGILLADAEWRSWSQHEIARITGASRHIVAECKKHLAHPNGHAPAGSLAGPASEPEHVTYRTKSGTVAKMKTGSIGKRKAKAEKEEAEDREGDGGTDEPQATEAPEVRDETGVPVPEHLEPVFRARDSFSGLLNDLTACSRTLNELHEAGLVRQQAVLDLRNCRQAVRLARPHAVCPQCHGKATHRDKPCEVCWSGPGQPGRGWVVEETYNRYQAANRGK